MKQNSVKDMLVKNLSKFIFGALVFSFFNLSALAATLLLPAGSNVNDVAVDSITGTVYITKTDGTIHSSTNGFNFTLMNAPQSEPASGPISPCRDPLGFPLGITEYYLKFKPNRINVSPNGALWMVAIAEKWANPCNSLSDFQIVNYSQNFLFVYDGANWIKRENAPNPNDVGVSSSTFFSSLSIYVVSKDSPLTMFYTGSAAGNSAFSSTGGTGFVRVDSKNNPSYNQPAGAWGVGANGTLWSFARNVIGGSPWFNTNQTNVSDVAVNKLTGRVYISKLSQVGGTIWYSDNNGATFTQEPASGFQNLAVTNNGVLYGARYDGSLWRF